jgi:hypothetical protein
MHSIALNRVITAALAVLTSCSALAAEPGPRVLTEPVLGLHYETSRVKFDSLPAHALANCETMRDNEYGKGVWFIQAEATDSSGRTYYISGGYEVRNDAPKQRPYETGGLGAVFFTDRGTCTYLDTARAVFEDRLFDDELPESVLKLLAADVAKRLVKAFGSADKLRKELRNQHIDKDTLPPELLAELRPYFVK